MNAPSSTPSQSAEMSRDAFVSALFANMIVQQTNMALVFLGQVPHPETGQAMQDLEAAKMFIDQLDMLAVKTRGNLDKMEEKLLQQSLMTLRMSFVEAVEKPGASSLVQPSAAPAEGKATEPAASSATAAETPLPPGTGSESTAEESRKRFTKKY